MRISTLRAVSLLSAVLAALLWTSPLWGQASNDSGAHASQRDLAPRDSSLRAAIQVEPGAVQRFIKDLQSPDEMVRLRAAKELGKLGSAASSAIPALQNALKDSDEDVRRIAAAAIERIQAAAAPSSARPITIGELGSLLQKTGYEVKPVTFNSAVTAHDIKVKKGTWDVNVRFDMSPNKKFVWASAYLGKVPPGAADHGDDLLRLLEKNWDTGPAFFVIEPKVNQFYLQRGMDNLEITAPRLREVIDHLADNVVNNVALWQKVVTPAAPLPGARSFSGAANKESATQSEQQDSKWDAGLEGLLKAAKLQYEKVTDEKKNRSYKVFYKLGDETSTIWINKGEWWGQFGAANEKKFDMVLWTEVLRLPPGSEPRPELMKKILEMNTFFNNGFALMGFNPRENTIYVLHSLFNHNLDQDLLLNHVSIMHQLRVKHRQALQPLLGSGSAPSAAVQKLIQDLGSPDEMVRLKGAKELGKLGPSANAAIPALQKLLQDADEDVRGVAANSIRLIQASAAPNEALQKLIQNLGSADELVRLKAAKDLAKMGPAAKDALPALQKLVQDPDEDVRRVVANAIERIRGTPAAAPFARSDLLGRWEVTEDGAKMIPVGTIYEFRDPDTLITSFTNGKSFDAKFEFKENLLHVWQMGKKYTTAITKLTKTEMVFGYQDGSTTVLRRAAGGNLPPTSVAGSTWSGSENLGGFGKLTFQFQADGKAVMIDAQTTVNGNWTQSGNQVTISFKNCVYTGTIQGEVLSGTARYTTADQTWTFSVTRNAAPK